MMNRTENKSRSIPDRMVAGIIFTVFAANVSTAVIGAENFDYTGLYGGSFIALRFDGYPSAAFKEPVNGEDWGSLYTAELNFYAYGSWKIGERGSKTWLLFNYGMLSLDFQDLRSAGEYSFDRTDHTFLRWGGLWRMDEYYALRAVFAPGYSADMGDVTFSEAFTPEGSAHLMWYPSGWETGIGAVYTYESGIPRILPSIIALKETGRYRFEILLPYYTDIFYKMGNGFEFGFAYEVWGHQYARNDEDFPGLEDPSLSYSVSSVGGGIGYWFDKFLYARIDIGYLYDRRLRYMEGDEDIVVLDPEESIYVKGYVVTGNF